MKKTIRLPLVLLLALLAAAFCGCDDNAGRLPAGTAVCDTQSDTRAAPVTLPDAVTDAPTEPAPTEPVTEPPTEPVPTEPAAEVPTEPASTEPVTEPCPGTAADAGKSDRDEPEERLMLGDLMDELQLDQGFRACADGALHIGINVFGMVIDTGLPVNGELLLGDGGLSWTSTLPLLGGYGFVLTDDTLYLREGERRRMFALRPGTDAEPDTEPQEETGGEPGTQPTAPGFSIDADALRERLAGLYGQAADALRDIPITLSDDHLYTVRLSDWAAVLADGLRSAMDRLPSGDTAGGIGGTGTPIDPQALLAWLDLIAADQDALLTVEADPLEDHTLLTVRLDCPVSLESLTAYAALRLDRKTGQLPDDVSRLLDQAVSEARITLTFTLGGGAQTILPPDDAAAYEQAALSELFPGGEGNAEQL